MPLVQRYFAKVGYLRDHDALLSLPARFQTVEAKNQFHPPQTPLNTPEGFFRRTFNHQLKRRHGGVVIFFALFLAISLLTRVALLVKAAHDVSWTPSLVAAFGWGLIYDLGAAGFAGLA